MVASTSDTTEIATEEQESRLDLSVLKEMARKALVDALNAVSTP